MEVGPFRTVNLGESGEVELRLVESGWEEYATVIFGKWCPRPDYGLSGADRRDGRLMRVDARRS